VASAPQYLELITVLDYVLIVAKPVLKAAVKSTKVSCMATVYVIFYASDKCGRTDQQSNSQKAKQS